MMPSSEAIADPEVRPDASALDLLGLVAVRDGAVRREGRVAVDPGAGRVEADLLDVDVGLDVGEVPVPLETPEDEVEPEPPGRAQVLQLAVQVLPLLDALGLAAAVLAGIGAGVDERAEGDPAVLHEPLEPSGIGVEALPVPVGPEAQRVVRVELIVLEPRRARVEEDRASDLAHGRKREAQLVDQGNAQLEVREGELVAED